jgi:hypothetical protein
LTLWKPEVAICIPILRGYGARGDGARCCERQQQDELSTIRGLIPLSMGPGMGVSDLSHRVGTLPSPDRSLGGNSLVSTGCGGCGSAKIRFCWVCSQRLENKGVRSKGNRNQFLGPGPGPGWAQFVWAVLPFWILLE